MLAIAGLEYGFSSRKVGEGVTFTLAPGETLAVLGGNGAGKTTLFRTLLGLLPARSGRVDVDGVPVAALTAAQRAAISQGNRLGLAAGIPGNPREGHHALAFKV